MSDRDLRPANMNGLEEVRALLREMGFEIVPIGINEMIAQAVRPVVREELERALRVIEITRSSVNVTVDTQPDECEHPDRAALDIKAMVALARGPERYT